MRGLCALLLPLLWLPAGNVLAAASIAGVCPDGSAFVVQRAADVPCARAKLVDPSELPPLRPDLLPRPYKWMVDQESRDPHNPYNLVDEARRIRALRAGEESARATTPARGAPAPLSDPELPRLALGEAELRELVALVALRQQVAPAGLIVEDIYQRPRLWLQLAHSQGLETRVLEATGESADRVRILALTARAATTVEFHPNFLLSQGALSFRPDPLQPDEVRFLVGEPGRLEEGAMLVAYLRIPARFDLTRPLTVFWNDRSFDATLTPE